MKNIVLISSCAFGVLFAATAACADDGKWPFAIVRSYGTGDENAQFLEALFAAQGRHPGLVEEIWFAGGGTGSGSNAYEQAIAPNIGWRDRCRSHGIAFSYQQGGTLGHDAGGENSQFLNDAWVVNEKGKNWPGIFCVNSPAALESNRRFMELVLRELQPDSYWPDDDMRLSKARWLGGYICMCDRCLSLFNKETGGSWTREALAKMLRDPSNNTPAGARVRDAWSKFNARSLARLTSVYRETADRVMPSCRLGLQVCDIRVQYQEAEPRIYLEGLSGNGRAGIGVRPGGGYWDERNHEKFVHKAVVEVMLESTRCRSYGFVKQCCYEAENWPHIAALKTPGSMMLECATVLAAGCDSLALYWGSDKNGEPRDTYDFFFETFAAWKPYLLAVRDMGVGTLPSGVSEFIGENTRIGDNWGWRNLHQYDRLAENAVPLSCKYGAIEAYWLDAERAKTISRADLPRLFAKPVLMTADAFPVMTKAFPDVGFLQKVEVRDFDGYETFKGGYKATNVSAAFVPRAADVKGLSGLEQEGRAVEGFGTCVIPTEFGGHVIGIQGIDMSRNLAGCQLWTSARREAILDALDSAVPGKMRARLLTGGHSVEIIVRADADGKTAGVFLLNASMGATRPLKLAIRNGKTVQWRVRTQASAVQVQTTQKPDGEVVIDLPPLPAASSCLISQSQP